MCNEDHIARQLNQPSIGLKVRDNNLYQTASTSLLNYYDNFSSIFFLANSTPVNLDIDTPMLKHLNDFINNMRPSQRSTGTTPSYEYFICLTEQEHHFYQKHQVLGPRPFDKLQHQNPRMHNDAISALNYLIYIASTTTSDTTYLSNTPNDSILYIYSFIVVPSGSTVWSRCNRRASYIELEPTDNQLQVPPTASWGLFNSIIMGIPTSILSFMKEGISHR